ncbi:helix-turn-helix domain-containing protein [Lysobacter soli]|uniref:helix-turn-helix domain-containing protein n=1 Tax=Lysobacter soli TaxID=453783 RepID=UPI0037C6371C
MTTWQNKVLELEERGWSLTALARATGASIGAISDLKQGRTKEPRANVALQLHHLHSTGAMPPEQGREAA